MTRRVWSPRPLAFGGTEPVGLAEHEAEAIVAWVWGVDAEQGSLEEIAEPLSATSAEPA